jgi:hypothetical protein
MLTSSSIGGARTSDIEQIAQQLFLRQTGAGTGGSSEALGTWEEDCDFGKLGPAHPAVLRVGPELRLEYGQLVDRAARSEE